MNYPAASSGVSNTLTKRVRSKLLAMNPTRFIFHQVLQSLAVGPFRPVLCSKWATSRAGQWPAGATGANENIPTPATEQKQHYNYDQ